MRRINNFHKSKPIVQNVKTDSVNEGKAPKQLTLDNDISDWNPGVASNQVNSINDVYTTDNVDEAKGDRATSAGAPTSYSQEVERYLEKQSLPRRWEKAVTKNLELRKALQSNFEETDSMKNEIEAFKKEEEKGEEKNPNALKNMEEQLRKLTVAKTDLENEMEKHQAHGNKLLSRAAKIGVKLMKAPIGKVPIEDVIPPEDIEKPIEEVEPIKVIPKEEVEEVIPPEKVKEEVPPEFEEVEVLPTKKKAAVAPEEIEPEAEVEVIDKDAAKVGQHLLKVRALSADNVDMHEAVKAGGIGLEVAVDGGEVETFWNFTRCSDGLAFYTTLNLTKRNYPEFWEDGAGVRYQMSGSSQVNPAKGASEVLPGVLYAGDYTGPTGLTSC